MKKVLARTIYSFSAISFFCSLHIKAQNLQSSNSLRKEKKVDSSYLLDKAPVIPDVSNVPLSLPLLSTVNQKIDLKDLDQKIEKTSDGIKDLIISIDESDLSKDQKKNIEESVKSIDFKNNEIIDLNSKLNDAGISEDEKRKLLYILSQKTQELEDKKTELSIIANKYNEQVGKNRQLRKDISTLNSSIETLRKLSNESIINLNVKILKLHLDNYTLATDLLLNQLNKLKDNKAILDSSLKKIKMEFEKLRWMRTKNMNDDDADIIEAMRDELRDELKNSETAKENLRIAIDTCEIKYVNHKNFGPVLTSGLEISDSYIEKTVNPALSAAQKAYNEATASIEKYKNLLKKYSEKYDRSLLVVSPRLEKYKTVEKKEENFSAFGGFKKILQEDGAFVPDINVFANKKFGNQEFGGYGQLRLFTGLNVDNARIIHL